MNFKYMMVGTLMAFTILLTMSKGVKAEEAKVQPVQTVTPFKAYKDPLNKNRYIVQFSSHILGPTPVNLAPYAILEKELYTSLSTTTIEFHLNNSGGSWDSFISLANAVKYSKAHVITRVTGKAQSAAAMLTCAADELIMMPNTHLMFHLYSVGFNTAKAHDIKSDMKQSDKDFEDYLRQNCVDKGILTNDQIDDILLGIDVYISADQFNKTDK